MISIICVFNRPDILKRCLLSSLDSQTTRFELIQVDNTKHQFPSAASALNHGARSATGDWLMFSHQDIILKEHDWLSRAERLLQTAGSGLGWAGVAGRTLLGEDKGFLIDRNALLGDPAPYPEEVLTLDECVLICRRTTPSDYFAEALDGWHAYGVDACLRAYREGRRNYVLPLLTQHDSMSANLSGLQAAHTKIQAIHGKSLPLVWTNSGYILAEHRPRSLMSRAASKLKRLSKCFWRKLQGTSEYRFAHPGEVLEHLLPGVAEIEIIHSYTYQSECIEVNSLIPGRSSSQIVRHKFSGVGEIEFRKPTVIHPGVTERIDARLLDAMLTKQKESTIWLMSPKTFQEKRWLVRKLQKRSTKIVYGIPWDGFRMTTWFFLTQ